MRSTPTLRRRKFSARRSWPGFSRLPVYEKDLDHILGYVHIKDIFRQQYMGWPLDVRKMMRPALFVPESMPLDRLLHLFQEQRNPTSDRAR